MKKLREDKGMPYLIKPYLIGDQLPANQRPGFIPVDDWKPSKEDELFVSCKGSVIAPVTQALGLTKHQPILFGQEIDESYAEKLNQLNTFALAPKRCYNGVRMREHLPKYLNYFEKFYDKDKELIMVMSKIKVNIDLVAGYREASSKR